MNPRKIGFLICLFAIAMVTTASAADKKGRALDRDETVKLFSNLDALNETVKTMEADVKKTIEDLELIDAYFKSEGVIRIQKPDKVYMEIKKPADKASALLVTKDELRVYYPMNKPPLMEVIHIGKNKEKSDDEKGNMGDVLSGLSFKLDDMEKKFKNYGRKSFVRQKCSLSYRR